jgi:hypothetical protein
VSKELRHVAIAVVCLAVGAAQSLAQDQASRLGDSGMDARALRFGTTLSQYSIAEHPELDTITTKHLKISGPLAHPLKSKKLSDVPSRFWHLINPFAKTEPKESIEPVAGMTPRPWASFADDRLHNSIASGPLTHESSLGLISISGR